LPIYQGDIRGTEPEQIAKEKRKSVNRMMESKNAKWDDLMRKSTGSITTAINRK